jgi:Mrp family chromosome partitioning ATPase
MLGRRERPPVLAELPRRDGANARPGALGAAELAAFQGLLGGLDDARLVLVTGAEGRSETALGLATVAVAEGREVALIECDLAVPTLAARIGLAEAPGLHEHLRGDADPAAVLQPLVLAGPAAKGAKAPLVCVVAGAATAEGPSLLDSERFGEALARMRDAYGLVILDGPPFEAEYSLRRAAKLVDATVACVPRPVTAKRLPVPVSGLVVRR